MSAIVFINIEGFKDKKRKEKIGLHYIIDLRSFFTSISEKIHQSTFLNQKLDAACNFSASCRIEIENNFPNFLDFNLALCIAMYQNCNDNFLNHSNSIQVPKDLRWCGESISEKYFCKECFAYFGDTLRNICDNATN